MCIRDSLSRYEFPDDIKPVGSIPRQGGRFYWQQISTAINAGAGMLYVCLLYTSDAADERSSVDLGGRRIIKKKKRDK